jgi:capsular polysaccharide biosynthesis protein
MELKAAAKRILWHAKLLVLFVAVGIAIPLALLSQHGPAVASTRLLIQGVTDAEAAGSTADAVEGIATSQTVLLQILRDQGEYADQASSSLGTIPLVKDVLREQGAREKPLDLAQRISAAPIGTSGIIELSVEDPDPDVAFVIANAVTSEVQAVMRDNGLTPNYLPQIIQSASAASTTYVPRRLTQMVVLGALAGLILGLLVTAVIETLSPTIVGREAIGESLGAPVLEVLPRPPGVGRPSNLSWLRWQLGARAKTSRVKTIELTSVGTRVDLLTLAEGLDPTSQDGTTLPGLTVRPLNAGSFSDLAPNRSPGLVAVLPRVVKGREAQRAKELAEVTGWPLVGVIAYERRRLGSLGTLFASVRARATSRGRVKMKRVA